MRGAALAALLVIALAASCRQGCADHFNQRQGAAGFAVPSQSGGAGAASSGAHPASAAQDAAEFDGGPFSRRQARALEAAGDNAGERRQLLQAPAVEPGSDNSTILVLAAELAAVAARLASHVGADARASLRRHRRAHMRPQHSQATQPAQGTPSARAATSQSTQAAVADIAAGAVKSTVVDFKGHRLTVVVLTNDEYVGKDIMISRRPFQPELLAQFLDFIPQGSTVVDAGANFGSFSIFFAAATGPTGRVYSFEPQARMFQLLCTNMMVNGMLHIVPKNNALSYQPGVLQLTSKLPDGRNVGKNYTDLDGKDTLNYGGMHIGSGGEQVAAITLDSLNINNVSFIKIDVQGAERVMMYGAQETIKRNMPVVAYESNAGAMAVDVEAALKVPASVQAFSIEGFLKSLGYTQPPALEHHARAGDAIWLPPNHPWLSTPAASAASGRRRRLLGLPWALGQ